MMEELNAQKVNKWLFWGMILMFITITYMNFSRTVHRAVVFAFSLPFWFMLVAGLLTAFFILNLIGRSQHMLDELEDELSAQRQAMVELERSFRLAKHDPEKLSDASFKRFCADVLRHLGHEQIKGAPSQLKGVHWQVFQDGKPAFVACETSTSTNLRGEIHQLYYQMLQKGVGQGIMMTRGHVDMEMEQWASSLGVHCLNTKKATHIAYSFLEMNKNANAKFRQRVGE